MKFFKSVQKTIQLIFYKKYGYFNQIAIEMKKGIAFSFLREFITEILQTNFKIFMITKEKYKNDLNSDLSGMK